MKVLAIELSNIENNTTECVGVVLDENQAINKLCDLFNDELLFQPNTSFILSKDIDSNIYGYINFFDKDDSYYKAVLKPFEVEF